jgi:tungstate transport system substrate-binding protein
VSTRAAVWTTVAAVAALVGCSATGGGTTRQASPSGIPSGAPEGTLVLATTTSTQDSGLLDTLVPDYETGSRCRVKTVAVGSGEALALGADGNADVLLVHSPAAEQQYMAQGHGLTREAVMHNDFVLLGPRNDPAHAARAGDTAKALAAIAAAHAPFASRADQSGTNAKELTLWARAGVKPTGGWYIRTGQGMGETLTIASQKQAYTLSDRGTYLATKNLDLRIVSEGQPELFNPYHVIVVKHAGTNLGCARQFAQWIVSAPTQQEIGRFGVKQHGQRLFVPDARP